MIFRGDSTALQWQERRLVRKLALCARYGADAKLPLSPLPWVAARAVTKFSLASDSNDRFNFNRSFEYD
jgi:hypothetical protein